MPSFQTFLFAKNAHKSRSGKGDGYPFDLDASLRYTRPKTGIDRFPTQDNYTLFAPLGLMNGGEGVSGLLPQQDIMVWAQGYGKNPAGPIVSGLPTLLDSDPFSTSAHILWQINIPGLTKQDTP